MVVTEYLRFMYKLRTADVPDDVRKIANLVLQHVYELIPLTTAHGQRIKKVVELAQTEWNSICSDIQPVKGQEEKQISPFTLIKTLTVGPFRGFTKQEDFDLSSKLVLLYGPNGSGKSSFCETLEYCLLNNVTEAESRRFPKQTDYLKNAYTNSFSPPLLIGIDTQGLETPIPASETLYRFCFIEKNRIDNFSRIAAQAPAKQTELISTLFGLDTFLEFVRNFTDSMDDKYIDFVGVKNEELNLKRKVLAGYKQNLETIPEELKQLDEAENELANRFHPGYSFSRMVIELNGSEECTGLIAQHEAELELPIDIKSNLTLSGLLLLRKSIEDDIRVLITKQQELANASQQISYKQLYEAVIEVKESNTGKCPACQTPLTQVTINPYEYAEKELETLKYLGELQNSISKLIGNVNISLINLSQIINTCCKNASDENILSAFYTTDENAVTINWWKSLHEKPDDELTPWQHIETQVTALENKDSEITQANEKRTQKKDELKRLRELAESITKLKTLSETVNTKQIKAEEEIEKFENENSILIAEAETEKGIVAQNKKIANAYTTFVKELNDYKDCLPAQLVMYLGETIVQLYNAFNRHDAEYEQLAVVKLPLQQSQRLEISYKCDPNSFFDALHILSEGHIRCMGLATLTAKNIKEGCPFLIFDDPINAIDDDHRESIRRTMFEDAYFEGKQIILTCHGEEFLKDIQNLLSAEKARLSKAISFLPKINKPEILVDHNCAPRNYVLASRAHFDKNELRDALDKSRKALESFAKGKIWQYVRKHSDGYLSINLRSVNASIELRNLTEQLKKKIGKSDFLDINKNAVLNPLEALLGKDGTSREWRYLNKGTHEESDRAEFDRQTVSCILEALEELDAIFA